MITATTTLEHATSKQLKTLIGLLKLPESVARQLSKDQAGILIRQHFEKEPWEEWLWCAPCGEVHLLKHRFSYQYVKAHRQVQP